MRKNLSAVLMLLALSLAQTGCTHNKDAVTLAQQMTVTANDLSTYYGALTQCAQAELAVLELEQALNHEQLDATNVAQLQETAKAFEQRQQMAAALASLASQLATLAGGTAPASVGTAVNALAADMTGIQALPVPGGTAIPAAVSQSAQAMMQWWQTRKERDFARSFAKTADAMSVLFAREEPAYDSVASTYSREAASVAIVLARNGEISDDSLAAELNPALKPFGLSTGSMTAVLRRQLASAAPALLETRAAQQAEQEQTASAALASNLNAMSQQADQLSAGKPPGKVALPASLTAVDAWTKTVLP
jgi:hypothetical protein